MGGRRPGPLCSTTSPPIDEGTMCRSRSRPPGALGTYDEGYPTENVLYFSALWNAYPNEKPYVNQKTGEVPSGYENQCAIKVSVALHGAGIDMDMYSGAYVTIKMNRAAVRAEELAKWLRFQSIKGMSLPESIVADDWQRRIKGRNGIVFFADYWLRPGEKLPSGDHIDLWNGSRLTASGIEGLLVTAARFGLGIASGPGFSDLGKSKRILFWQVVR